MKDTQYFPHDLTAINDPKIGAMMSQYGIAGYGLYWYIIEQLHINENHQLPHKEWQMLAIAKQVIVEVDFVKKFLKDCVELYELFSSNDGFFWCERVHRNFKKREEISQKRAESGRKGGLGKAESSLGKQKKANAKQDVANKKDKEKEKNIENNIKDSFQSFWDAYGKKNDREKCEAKWEKLSTSEHEAIMADIPKYLSTITDKQFQKNPLTYLNGKCWNDEREPSKPATRLDQPPVARKYLNDV